MYNVIVAGCMTSSEQRLGIGALKDNKPSIPWMCKIDMKHFKDITNGNFVIMGRKTWESIPEKFRPLPNRYNIVITSNAGSCEIKPGLMFVNNLQEGLDFYETMRDQSDKYLHKDLFIIGGAEVYEQFITEHSDKIYKLYLTKIHNYFECDKYFNLDKYMKANPMRQIMHFGTEKSSEYELQYTISVYEYGI